MTTRATEDGTVRDDLPVAGDFALVVRVVSDTGSPTGALQPGAETIVSPAVAVMVLGANAIGAGLPGARLTAIIQNKGGANVCIGPVGVTAATGLRLIPNMIEIFDQPNIVRGEIWAIGEAADSLVFAQEIVIA